MQPIRTEHWLGVSETDDELTQQILDATFELICQFGIRRTSFDDIARKAKVGRATVFRRMKDKPQLLQMLVQRELGRFIRAIRQHSEKLEDPKDRFVQGVMMAIRLACANPMLRGLLSAEPEATLPLFSQSGSPFFLLAHQYLSVELAQLRDQKGFLQGKDIDLVAEGLVRIMQSFVLTPALQGEVLDEARLAEFCRLFVEPALS